MRTRVPMTQCLAAAVAVCFVVAGAQAQQSPQSPQSEQEPDAQQTQPPQQQTRQPNEQQAPQRGDTRAPDQPAGARQDQPERGIMLGIAIEPETATENGVPIAAVRPGSAAANANLQTGDVIVSLAGQKVTSPDQLQQIVQNQAAGDEAELVFLRNGEQNQSTVRFTEMQPPGRRHQAVRPGADPATQSSRGWLGVTLDPGDEQNQQPGVEIRRVYPAGPAAQTGLTRGTRIVEVDGQSVSSTEEVLSALSGMKPGQTVELTVSANGEQRTVTPTLEDRGAFGMVEQRTFGDSDSREPFLWRDPSGFQTTIPEHDMMLEQHRRLAEQHERLENLLYEVKEDLEQIKRQLGERGTASNPPEASDTRRE